VSGGGAGHSAAESGGPLIDAGRIAECSRASGSRAELWRGLLALLNPRTVLEVGVLSGGFSAELLSSCGSIERYYMLDPWRRLDDWNKPLNSDDWALSAAYEEAMRSTDFAAEKRLVLRGTTLEVIDQIPDASVDFAYIDADHTLRGITIDLIATWPKIAPAGWIGGDDFTKTIWQHGAKFEPTLVFPFATHFAEAVGAELFALRHEQFLMRKAPPGGRRFSFTDLAGGHQDRSLLGQFPPLQRATIELSRKLKRRSQK